MGSCLGALVEGLQIKILYASMQCLFQNLPLWRPMTSKKHRLPQWLLVAAVIYFLIHISYGLQDPGRDDFVGVFLFYAQNYIDNGNIYADPWNYYDAFEPTRSVYKFPPFYGATLVNLLKLKLPATVITYLVAVTFVFLFLASVCLCATALASRDNRNEWMLLVAIGLLFAPLLRDNLRCLQPEMFMVFFMSAALFYLSRENHFWSGFMVGMAAAVKIYPGLAILHFVVEKRWNAIGGFFVALSIVTGYTLLSVGWMEHARYLYFIIPVLFTEFPIPNHGINISPLIFPVYYPDISGETAKHIHHAITVFFVGMCIYASFIRTRFSELSTFKEGLLKLSMYVIAAILVLANSWWYYQIILLIPVLVLAMYFLDNAGRQKQLFATYIMACSVLAVTIHMAPLTDTYALLEWTKLQTFIYVLARGSASLMLFAVVFSVLISNKSQNQGWLHQRSST